MIYQKHTQSVRYGLWTQRDASRERGMKASIESESGTSELQMVSVTGVIIIGNYATLVIL